MPGSEPTAAATPAFCGQMLPAAQTSAIANQRPLDCWKDMRDIIPPLCRSPEIVLTFRGYQKMSENLRSESGSARGFPIQNRRYAPIIGSAVWVNAPLEV